MFNSKAKAVWRLQWHQMSSKLDVIGNMHKHIRVIEASDIKSEGYTDFLLRATYHLSTLQFPMGHIFIQ